MHLTEEEIKNGFWCPRPDFPPAPISDIEEYTGTDKLNLVCTQLDSTSSNQKRLVKEWVQTLRGLKQVRFLWFNSRVSQELFDAACQIEGLKGLYIKWSVIKDISALKAAEQLQFLSIGSSPGIQNVEVLSDLRQLIVLELENIKKLRQLEVLGNLTQLEALAVTGSTWTKQIVESLSPISRLSSLRYLCLISLRSLDRTLLPLRELTSLVNLLTAYWWPIEDFKLLRESLPNLKYGTVFHEELIEQFGKR